MVLVYRENPPEQVVVRDPERGRYSCPKKRQQGSGMPSRSPPPSPGASDPSSFRPGRGVRRQGPISTPLLHIRHVQAIPINPTCLRTYSPELRIGISSFNRRGASTGHGPRSVRAICHYLVRSLTYVVHAASCIMNGLICRLLGEFELRGFLHRGHIHCRTQSQSFSRQLCRGTKG